MLIRTTRTLWRVGGCSFSWWSDHIDIEVTKPRWSYSDTVAKMTRRWDFPLRKSSFLIGLRWERASFFNDAIFQPDLSSGKSHRREQTTVASPSKTRSVCINRHIYIQCCLSKLNHLYRRWRDPLYPRVPRPGSQFCSHLRRRVRRSRKRNIYYINSNLLHLFISYILQYIPTYITYIPYYCMILLFFFSLYFWINVL